MSDIDEARRQLIRAGFTPEQANDARLTRLRGLTNIVFKVEPEAWADGSPLCLRLPGPGSASVADRRREAANACTAAAAGVAPEVVYFGTDGAMLARFVEGEPVTPARLKLDPGALARAAHAMRRLHDEAEDFVDTFRTFETMDRYIALLDETGASVPDRHRAVLTAAEGVREALAATPMPLRPCHCDPTGGNLLDTGERVWLVDWEYAAMNDPMWDLAYFSVEAGLNDAGDRALLQAYFRRPPEAAELARLEVTKASCELLSALWALVQLAEGNRITDFADLAERYFEHASARMARPNFAGQLEVLRHG